MPAKTFGSYYQGQRLPSAHAAAAQRLTLTGIVPRNCWPRLPGGQRANVSGWYPYDPALLVVDGTVGICRLAKGVPRRPCVQESRDEIPTSVDADFLNTTTTFNRIELRR